MPATRGLRSELPNIVNAYESGETAEQIASRHGVSKRTILNWLHKAGVRMRPSGRSLSFDESLALFLNEQGASDAYIGAKLGTSEKNVQQWRSRRNIPGRGKCYACDNVFIYTYSGQSYCENCDAPLPPGSRVGNFEIVTYLGRHPKGGKRYRVRDLRCGHENEVSIHPSRPFVGRKTLCGCPVRRIAKDGYVFWGWQLPDGRSVIVPEHRIVMEQKLGRPLRDEETVHHINLNKSDNHPDNLQPRQGNHGTGAAFRCHDCGSHNVTAVPLTDYQLATGE